MAESLTWLSTDGSSFRENRKVDSRQSKRSRNRSTPSFQSRSKYRQNRHRRKTVGLPSGTLEGVSTPISSPHYVLNDCIGLKRLEVVVFLTGADQCDRLSHYVG